MTAQLLIFASKRLAALFLTLLVGSFLIYAALFLAPGEPATLIAGGQHPNPEALKAIQAEYHLNDPFLSQYWQWLTNALHGDFGRSIVFHAPVGELISSRLMNTVFLVSYAAILILVIGVGLGIVAALRGGATNTAVTVGTTVAMGAPTFVMGIFLIWLFATQLSWLPVYGSGTGFFGRLEHLTLPAIALAFTYVAYVSRVTRTAVKSELHADHVATARSRGVPRRIVIRRHVLRNASAPILAVGGLTVAGLIAGTAVAEQIFGVNGIGALLVEAAARQDFPVVQAIALIMIAGFVVVSTIVDMISVALDPRLAIQGAS